MFEVWESLTDRLLGPFDSYEEAEEEVGGPFKKDYFIFEVVTDAA